MCIDTEYQYEQEGSPAVSCAYVCRQLRAGVTVFVEVMAVYTIWSFEWATTGEVKCALYDVFGSMDVQW